MFTGLIEEVGRVVEIVTEAGGVRLSVTANIVTSDINDGDSIAVNGICLTAMDTSYSRFSAEVSPETLHRTTLGGLVKDSPVNLERAVTPSTRLGGHIVQGHVDGRGTFVSALEQGEFRTLRIRFPAELGRYFVEKGSVAVEGISLTIAAMNEDNFEIAVIPKTWQITNLSTLRPGDHVNLEVDIIAKYVERMLTFKLAVTRPDREA
ncbi:MAG: riboflavin synthase [Pyrinomonadaceae bacterium]